MAALVDDGWRVVLAFVPDPRDCALVCVVWANILESYHRGGLRGYYVALGIAVPDPGAGALPEAESCSRCGATSLQAFRWPFCVW